MKKLLLVFVAFFLFSSHDMFLKMDSSFLEPNTPSKIQLYNGTFDKSENTIDRNRMIDVSLVGNGIRTRVDTTQWTEKENTTILNFKTGEAGTWVAGVSTRARDLAMSAKDFNEYLEHDGVIDMLEMRKKNNTLDQDAVERYSKHVKTIFQVGDKKTDDWKTELGYPIEFVPLSNPYDLHSGDSFEAKLLWQGKPLANQLVYTDFESVGHGHSHSHGHEHDHDSEEGHSHDSADQLRTNENGIVKMKISEDGRWYLRTIYLAHSEAPGLTHESNWATLTFEVNHSKGHAHGLPKFAYWLIGGLLLVMLFMYFRP